MSEALEPREIMSYSITVERVVVIYKQISERHRISSTTNWAAQLLGSRHEAAKLCPSAAAALAPFFPSLGFCLTAMTTLERTQSRPAMCHWKLGQHEKHFKTIAYEIIFGGYFSINISSPSFILLFASRRFYFEMCLKGNNNLYFFLFPSLRSIFVWSVFLYATIFSFFFFVNSKSNNSSAEWEKDGEKCVTFGLLLYCFFCVCNRMMPSGF